ncbi:hypothetical protein [Orenia marismortui]|uniref:hypothetical protein n=1 Tax=Orenia marismortui TaxID=46469 RepID=UPI000380A202|nr:hypothetical protein [Orenia marismortui]
MLIDAFDFAKLTISKNKSFFLKLFLLGFIIDMTPAVLRVTVNKNSLLPIMLISVILNILFFIFLIKMGIDFYDSGSSKLSSMFKIDLILYFKLLIAFIVVGIISLLPLVLFIFPVIGWLLGIVLMIILFIKLYFVNYLIIDDDLGPLEAVYKSMEIVEGHGWEAFGIFVIFLICGIITIFIQDGIKYLLKIDSHTIYSFLIKLSNSQLFLSDLENWDQATNLLSKGVDSTFSLFMEIVGSLFVVYIYKTMKGDFHNSISSIDVE